MISSKLVQGFRHGLAPFFRMLTACGQAITVVVDTTVTVAPLVVVDGAGVVGAAGHRQEQPLEARLTPHDVDR
jgi:hypothetical protein